MPRVVRLRSDGIPEIRAFSWPGLLSRSDVGLISALGVAWVAGTALQLTHVIESRAPLGALAVVLIRTLCVSGTGWLATILLGQGADR